MTKGRKWAIAASVALVAAALGWLVLGSFKDSLVYFYTPSEVEKLTRDFYGQKVRVGGMVEKGSVVVAPKSLKINFRLTDGAATIPVAYEGVPPDLFKEGQGAVVEGSWEQDRVFHANFIMAKHSEDYMPIEMKRAGKVLPKEDLLKTLQK